MVVETMVVMAWGLWLEEWEVDWECLDCAFGCWEDLMLGRPNRCDSKAECTENRCFLSDRRRLGKAGDSSSTP